MSIETLPALRPARAPWNKGRIVGQKRPLLPKHVWSIRVRLEMADNRRDLAGIDRDHNLIHVPLVVRARSIATDTTGEMRTEPVDPQAHCFAADNHAALHQKILDISCAQRKAMVNPNRIGHYLTWKTKALQARHARRDEHARALPPTADTNNLAMPLRLLKNRTIGMAIERLTMRHTRDVLGLKFAQELSEHTIAAWRGLVASCSGQSSRPGSGNRYCREQRAT